MDDAGEGELDVNDVAIELAARKIHAMRIWRAWRDSNEIEANDGDKGTGITDRAIATNQRVF